MIARAASCGCFVVAPSAQIGENAGMELVTEPSKQRKKRSKSPKHAGIVRAFRFAMAVPEKRAVPLFEAADTLNAVRNDLVGMLDGRRHENRRRREIGEEPLPWLTFADLAKSVSAARADNPSLDALHSHLAQSVCDRVLEGQKRWLEALADGRSGVRPPRRRERKHTRSFAYKQYGNGCRIQNGRVFLSGFGWFKLHDHRKMRGKPQTVTVKFAEGRWWCIVTVRIAEADWFGRANRPSKPDAGADPGLSSLLTDSHGNAFDPPRAMTERRRQLRREQRDMARKFRAREANHGKAVAEAAASGGKLPPLRDIPYSNRLKKQIRRVAKVHTKADRVRDHHQKKIASVERSRFGRIAVEEHGLMFMFKNRRMARAAADRAIGGMKHAVASAFGKDCVMVPNRRAGIGGNSQTCLCGASVPKDLKVRVHKCDACGLEAPRDVVSANIAQAIGFGTVSGKLVSFYPAGGQPVVRRGADEAAHGESRSASARKGASESAAKRPTRASPKTRQSHTAGAKATAEGKTTWNRKRPRPPTLPVAPHSVSSKREAPPR